MKAVFSLAFALCAAVSFGGTCTVKFDWYRNAAVSDLQVPLTLEEGYNGFTYMGSAADGSDLRVIDGATVLPHRIVKWNAGGKTVVWVKVPSFSKDTVLTLKWGADAAGIDAAPTTGFWDSAMVVCHLGAAADKAVNDVDGLEVPVNANTPNAVITRTDSPVGQAAVFNKTGSYSKEGIAMDSHYGQSVSAFTVSFWMQTDDRSKANNQTYAIYLGDPSYQRAILMNWNKNAEITLYLSGGYAGTWSNSDYGIAIPDTRWHHYALTYNGAKIRAYVDGFLKWEKPLNGFSINGWTSNGKLSIGSSPSGGSKLIGCFDEIRIEPEAREADYVRASVETQSQLMPGYGRSLVDFADYAGSAIADFPAYVLIDRSQGAVPQDIYDGIRSGAMAVVDRETGRMVPVEFECIYTNAIDDVVGFWARVPRYSSQDGLLLKPCAYYIPAGTAVTNVVSGPAIWDEAVHAAVFHLSMPLWGQAGEYGRFYSSVRTSNNYLTPCYKDVSHRDSLAAYPVSADGPSGPYQAYYSTTNVAQETFPSSAEEKRWFKFSTALTNVWTISWWMQRTPEQFANPKPHTYVWTVQDLQLLEGPGYTDYCTAANTMSLYSWGKDTAMAIPDTDWHHYAYVCDGKVTRAYRDGVEQKLYKGVIKDFGLPNGTDCATISLCASVNPGGNPWIGGVDEFRVEAVARSADWLKAVWHNGMAWQSGAPNRLVPHIAPGVSATTASGSFTVKARLVCRTTADVAVFWGESDGGTSTGPWAHADPVGSALEPDEVSKTVKVSADGKRRVFRVRATNAYGTIWSEPVYVDDPTVAGNRADGYKITVNYTGDETLVNFPLCVRLPASCELPDDKTRVRFEDADGAVLPWEAESWDPAGESVVWVRVPALVRGTKIVLRKVPTGAGEGVTAQTWPASEYAAVYHFASSAKAGCVTKDSSSYANDVTACTSGFAAATDGVVGEAFDWPRTADSSAAMTDDKSGRPLNDFRNGFTMSAWLKIPDDSATGTGDNGQVFARYDVDIVKRPNWFYQTYLAWHLTYDHQYARGKVALGLYSSDSRYVMHWTSLQWMGCTQGLLSTITGQPNSAQAITTATQLDRPDAGWHHYVFTQDGDTFRTYRDGVLQSCYSWPFQLNAGTLDMKTMKASFGKLSGAEGCAKGSMDEFRFERLGRSADWVKASFENQKANSTFLTIRPIGGLVLVVR